MTTTRRALSCLFLLTTLSVARSAAAENESYSYFRIVDGSAFVTPASNGERESAEVNRPLLTGDRIEVAPDSRVEVVLSDRSRLRLDGGTEVVLRSVAFSSDAAGRTTRLQLLAGTAQLSVGEETLGDELPRIDLRNASVYLQDVGELLLSTDGDAWSEVVVRSGFAEVVTERGSTVVRAGEAARVTGSRSASTKLGTAPATGALERWARARENESGVRRAGYVDPGLAYSAANLEDHGSWIYVEDSWAWRPRVTADWRPYWNGRWSYTPSGQTWISSEAWGWVPYHYGTWNLAPGYGWVWYPGRTYSPAWVYWYLGDSWSGWCPVGYYTRHYRGSWWDRGFRSGVYGTIGGGIDLYAHWNFGPSHLLFDRHHRGGYRRGGADLARELGGRGLPRGVLTTDTRDLDPIRLRGGRNPRELVRTREGAPEGSLERLPDVTDFIARKPELSPEVRHRILVEKPGQGGWNGTPLAPPSAEPGLQAREPRGWRVGREGGEASRIDERPARRETPPAEVSGSPQEQTGIRDRPAARTGRAPRLEIEGSSPTLDERPARRSSPEVPWAPAVRGRERPGAPDPTEGGVAADEALPPRLERGGRTTLSERPQAIPGSPDGRQNWRRRNPGEAGSAAETNGERGETPTSRNRPEPGSWRSPDLGEPRRSPPPPGNPEGRRLRSRPEGGDQVPSPVFERPARSGGSRGTSMPAGGPSPFAGSDRPPVRRVIDGVRQAPTGGPRTGPGTDGGSRSPGASPAESAPRTERHSGRREAPREAAPHESGGRKSPPPPEGR